MQHFDVAGEEETEKAEKTEETEETESDVNVLCSLYIFELSV